MESGEKKEDRNRNSHSCVAEGSRLVHRLVCFSCLMLNIWTERLWNNYIQELNSSKGSTLSSGAGSLSFVEVCDGFKAKNRRGELLDENSECASRLL